MHEERLWLVAKVPTIGNPKFATARERYWVFRTRTAARKFARDKNASRRKRQYRYLVVPYIVTWGPD